MTLESIFDYLKKDNRFDEVYENCRDMELMLMLDRPKISLSLARKASELLIKLIIDKHPDFKAKLKKQAKKNNRKFPTLFEMIEGSKDKGIIPEHLYHRYNKIRTTGNKSVHASKANNFGENKTKNIHENLFHITLSCFNEYHKDNKIHIPYEYNIDKLMNDDYSIEFTSQNRDFVLKSIQVNELDKEVLEEKLDSKTIFIPVDCFNRIIKNYNEKIKDESKLEKYMEGIAYIDDENIEGILKNFMGSSHNSIKEDLKQAHNKLSERLMEVLKELNHHELSFSEINNLIKNSKNSEEKIIYEHIKALSDDIAKSVMAEYIKEMENSPITRWREFGRKVNEYNKYELVEDDFGFSIREVDENIFLDDDQKAAVEYSGKKPLVVNAGPGSGKTRVIIERVVYLVNELKKDPSSILVITFTRKATQELRERLINETDLDMNDINKIHISTVHSFCRQIISRYDPMPFNYLRRYGERSLFFRKYKEDLGFTKYAFLYDHWITGILEKYDEFFNFKVDTEGLVKSLETKIDSKEIKERYMDYIDEFYNEHGIEEYPDFYKKNFKYKSISYDFRHLTLAKSYPKFKQIMRKTKTCDDNTILEKANSILENESILKNLRYKNILIDEFQDTDRYQKEIFDKLLGISETFTIVGDIDQSIFGFRGAFPEYFEEFRKRDVEEVILHTNYRSTKDIVEFNEELIKDKRNFEKNMISKKKYKAPIFHMANANEEDQAERISELIKTLKNDNIIKYYSDVAVLFRTNKSVERLIKPFEYRDIPYILKDNKDYLMQNEVRAVLTMFWYLMPYNRYELNHLGDDFLNLYGFTDVKYKSSDIFRLSKDTMDLLAKIQSEYEDKLVKIFNKHYTRLTGNFTHYGYKDIFERSEEKQKELFRDIKTFDIGLLDKEGLLQLGIRNENDLEFFLKLNNLKAKLWENNPFGEKMDTLKLFYKLLNMTEYFNQISLDNRDESIKVKENLALFSSIIKDYESIMGDTDYKGLFRYLSRVLKGYASPFNEEDAGFDKVHLLSMHSAKGLQYPVVIVGSLKQNYAPLKFEESDDLFHTPRKYLEYKETDTEKARKKHDDEEIRTIYVATTRAKEVLILSTLKDTRSEIPAFLEKIKLNPDITIEELEPHNPKSIPKVESSKVYQTKDSFPKINFEDLINDYLYCPYRYDLANNTRFKVKIKNDKYIDMVIHNLLENIHSKVSISNKDEMDFMYGVDELNIDEKIDTILKYHNVSTKNEFFDIIKNVKTYWEKYGKSYKILYNDLNHLTQMKYCDLHCKIDLVIEENDGSYSVVKFIPSDSNISDIELYKFFSVYYIHALKELDEFKEKEFKNVYLYSLSNDKMHSIGYEQELCAEILKFIQDYSKDIYDKNYRKTYEKENCETCEYKGNVCNG